MLRWIDCWKRAAVTCFRVLVPYLLGGLRKKTRKFSQASRWWGQNISAITLKTYNPVYVYRGADKSLALPGRKQDTATEDFDVHVSYL